MTSATGAAPDHRHDRPGRAGAAWLRARHWLFMIAYEGLWHVALPAIAGYLLHRARKDPDWRRGWAERLGAAPECAGAVWIHAVSLGEMRAAIPLVRALLARGERVVTTHLTPAGRREALRVFAPEVAQGRVRVCHVPIETGWAWRRFFLRVRPRLGMVIEQEIWPVMIDSARRAGVALFLANSQITHHGYRRALRLHRAVGHPVGAVAGVMAKADAHAANFRSLGVGRVAVCGELRFDQPVPRAMTEAAAQLRSHPASGLARPLADAANGKPPQGARPVVTLASVVAGEEETYLDIFMQIRARAQALGQPLPLLVFVPRAIERFDIAAATIAARGLRLVRRSAVLDRALRAPDPGCLANADVLLGDSMGEMFFYLGLADAVITGGGFLRAGAHNVIEPLLLGKPVLVGPEIWTIAFPANEAAEAGLLAVCATPAEMAERLWPMLHDGDWQAVHAGCATAFLQGYGGAVERILRQADDWMTPAAPPGPQAR